MSFKEGQTVVCNDNAGAEEHFTEGFTYVVAGSKVPFIYMKCALGEDCDSFGSKIGGCGWYNDRFSLVEDKPVNKLLIQVFPKQQSPLRQLSVESSDSVLGQRWNTIDLCHSEATWKYSAIREEAEKAMIACDRWAKRHWRNLGFCKKCNTTLGIEVKFYGRIITRPLSIDAVCQNGHFDRLLIGRIDPMQFLEE